MLRKGFYFTLVMVWLTLAWFGPVISQADEPDFGDWRPVGPGMDTTQSLVVGDMDNDGHLDLVVGNLGEQNRVYFNDGDGTFSLEDSHPFGTGDDCTIAVLVADFDLDGDLDILSGNQYTFPGMGVCDGYSGSIAYLNDGSGNFDWPGASKPVGPEVNETTTITLGDVNQDGYVDILLGQHFGLRNRIYLNDFNGNFDWDNNYYLFGKADDIATSLAVIDINRDGLLDIVIGNDSDENQIYFNNGDPYLSWLDDTPHTFGDNRHPDTAMTIGDVNDDGWLDIVVGNTDNADLTYWPNIVYLNDGGGHFPQGNIDCDSPPANIICFGPNYDDTTSITLGDMNGDGYLDIIVGNGGQGVGEPNVVYLNNRTGHFTETNAARVFGPGNDETYSVAVGDMNDDGALDIATGNSAGQNAVYFSDKGGEFAPWQPINAVDQLSTPDIELGDMDGDGLIDVLVGGTIIHFNDQTDGFTWPPPTKPISSTLTEQTVSLMAGDINGDGYADLVFGNDNGPSTLYLNDGAGHFDWPGGMYPLDNIATNTESIALADLNLDGRLDIIVGNYREMNEIYFNTVATGTQELGWAGTKIFLDTITDTTTGVAVGDVNGDAWPDIVVGNNKNFNSVYYNDGTGYFSGTALIHTFGMTHTVTEDVTLVDVNGDGWLDVVEANRLRENAIYLNDGQGKFDNSETMTYFGGEYDRTFQVVGADIDNDEDRDLIVANNSSKESIIYLNDGSGTFSGDNIRRFEIGSHRTQHILTVDLNQDGWLDLVVSDRSYRNMIYMNDGGGNFDWPGAAHYFATSRVNTYALGEADFNGDGWPDIVLGSPSYHEDDYYNEIAFNQGGGQFLNDGLGQADSNGDLALGDINGDNTVDMVTGNTILLNDSNGNFYTWASCDDPALYVRCFGGAEERITEIRLSDIDGDGPLDIVVTASGYGVGGQNYIYFNDEAGYFFKGIVDCTAPPLDVACLGGEADISYDFVTGDFNNDGYTDIVVGNKGQQNLLYLNDGQRHFYTGSVTAVDCFNPPAFVRCIGPHKSETVSLGVGDFNGDGSLDVAVGNQASQNFIYLNDGGGNFYKFTTDCAVLPPTVRCFGNGSENNPSLYVQDIDGDGALDLLVGSNDWGSEEYNLVYLNDGRGNFRREAQRNFDQWRVYTHLISGDVNGDGSPDLLSGNGSPTGNTSDNVTYNYTRLTRGLGDTHPYLSVQSPISTPQVLDQPGADVLQQTIIPIQYKLFDAEGQSARMIRAFYSPNGGGQWFPATPATGTITQNLTTAPWPAGKTHTFLWHAEKDLIKSDNVRFRLAVYQDIGGIGPYQWPYYAAHTNPFRVEMPWYIKVVDDQNLPVAGSSVFLNGQLITQTVTGLAVTDQAGLLNIGPIPLSSTLVALSQQAEQETVREGHDGWAYRTYLTNISLDAQGSTALYTVTQVGEQRLQVASNQALILFNLLISIEWDATDTYLAEVAAGAELAANYLYDVTDGQMTFGEVTIYDKATYWEEADIQISTKNIVRPYAGVSGITDTIKLKTIRLGRYWDGRYGDRGPWDEPNGYKTIVHEFGHYGLGLYDEYIGYKVKDGDLVSQLEISCIDLKTGDAKIDASIMDKQYITSELADVSQWVGSCQDTVQAKINEEADWQTLLRYYGDKTGQDRWQLVTPDDRAGDNQSVAGPETLPTGLTLPQVVITNTGTSPTPFTLSICYEDQLFDEYVWVTLLTSEHPIDQGIIYQGGTLEILGATSNDTLNLLSRDGSLTRRVSVAEAREGCVNLNPNVSRQATIGELPYIQLWPNATNGQFDGFEIVVNQTTSTDNLRYTLTGFGGEGSSPTALTYNNQTERHQGEITFLPGTEADYIQGGYTWVFGTHNNQVVDLTVDYRLQYIHNLNHTHIFANDGNLTLYLPPDALPSADLYLLVTTASGLPGPLPAGWRAVGEVYELTASNKQLVLNTPGLLTFDYETVSQGHFETLAIYRWQPALDRWQRVEGEDDLGVSVPITELGIYVLLGIPDDFYTYIPLILK